MNQEPFWPREISDGIIVEHWDVIQDEATRETSKSGKPMFGDNVSEMSNGLGKLP
jgi:hypothetical protein